MWPAHHSTSFAATASPTSDHSQNIPALDSSTTGPAMMNNMMQPAMHPFPSFPSTPSRSFDGANRDGSSGRKRAHPDGPLLLAPSPIMADRENTVDSASHAVPCSEQRGEVSYGQLPSFDAGGDGGGGDTVLARMPLVERPTPLSRERMREYLSDPEAYECCVALFHAKVVQKSYGNEKRYFCPPPCVYLRGKGWDLKKERVEEMYKDARASLFNDSAFDEEKIDDDQAAILCAYLGLGGGLEPQLLNFRDHKQQITNFASCSGGTRGLFIKDEDKRRYFELQLQLFYACGLDVGAFPSTRVKVISKPSKKKQSLRNTDCKFLCIQGDGKVALFNRNKSNSTRYMYVEDNGQYSASSQRWSALTMHISMEDDPQTQDEKKTRFTVQEGFVHYGDVVKLVDSTTGWSLPKMRIRKVVGPTEREKGTHVVLDPKTHDEPVSQLHKCAFQLLDDDLSYLWMSHDSIIQGKASRVPGNPDRLEISDGAGWTIISADTVEYRFFESAGPVRDPLSPAPRLLSYEMMGPTEKQRFMLTGRNFTHNLKVWLHTVELETIIRSENQAVASLPSVTEMTNACPEEEIDNTELEISFVRDDGVVYRSDMCYTYQSYPVV